MPVGGLPKLQVYIYYINNARAKNESLAAKQKTKATGLKGMPGSHCFPLRHATKGENDFEK